MDVHKLICSIFGFYVWLSINVWQKTFLFLHPAISKLLDYPCSNMDTMRRSVHLIDRTDGISPSLPVIYKAISSSELQHLPHTASGADMLLTNNIAANGPKPTVALTTDRTRTPHSRVSGFISIQTLRRKSLWFVCFWGKSSHTSDHSSKYLISLCVNITVDKNELLFIVGKTYPQTNSFWAMNEAARGTFFKKQRSDMAPLKILSCCAVFVILSWFDLL